MFSSSDYNKLQQIMEESPEKKELLEHLLSSHQMEISAISHEIRNPLTLVYSTLQLIESQHPEVLTFRYWNDMHHDIEYMKLLLEELSAYNNGERLTLCDIDTSTFFRSLSLSFASSLIDSDTEFVSQIDETLPVIQGDYLKLRQVFLNLLGNARDALTMISPDVRRKREIFLSVAYKENHLTVIVRDNGCGIPSDQLPHIFEPFVTYKKNGTGLGLSITERIIKAHNGTIQVSSIPDSFTTFLLTLPVKKHT